LAAHAAVFVVVVSIVAFFLIVYGAISTVGAQVLRTNADAIIAGVVSGAGAVVIARSPVG
jgi:hypothetical protein